MLTTLVVLLMVTPAAPPPPQPLSREKPAPDAVAALYAQRMQLLIGQIPETYLKPVEESALVRAATEGLFRASRQDVPRSLDRILKNGSLESYEKLKLARSLAGSPAELDGVRGYIHSANAMTSVLDSGCIISLYPSGSIALSDVELIIGLELDGISLLDWQVYRVETGPQSGWTEPPPIPLPWRVKRVTAGMAAAKADIQPNDVIHAVSGTPVRRENAAQLLLPFLIPLRGQNLPVIGNAVGKRVSLEIERAGKRFTVEFDVPETNAETLGREMIFGYSRRKDGTWDYFTDKTNRIAYLRLNVFEDEMPNLLAATLNQIADEQPRALLLDLRWTPGGLLHAGGRAGSLFFRDNQSLGKLQWRNPARFGETLQRIPEGTVDRLWTTIPLAALTNGETYGGGETIAAAIQDNKRGTIIGQRTPGRGLIVGTIVPDVPGLRYRITTGKTDRATGKNRHRYEHLGPLDDWGVRPDAGFEIPTTPEMTKKLRELHEQKSIRPNGAVVAIALDDPLADPQRVLAIKLLKEKILAKPK